MMVLNLSASLSKRLKIDPPKGPTKDPVPYEDWFGHTFIVERKQYILSVDGYSKFAAIIEAKGLKDAEHYAGSLLIEVMDLCKVYKIREPLSKVLFARTEGLVIQRSSDKSVISTINQMIYHAGFYLAEGRSTIETALNLNEMPMSVVKGHYFPIDRFVGHKLRLTR